MRIVIQGSLTAKQMGDVVKEIVSNTLEKAEVKGKRAVLHNPVVEFNLNIQGEEQPQLLVDDEKGTMLTIHTGYKDGEMTEYVEVDRSELISKFDEMVANATGEEVKKDVE